jgi:glycosyltransferase involved in cell wall biosynthesis
MVDASFFSVILPVYNTPESLLRRAIESLINQSFTEWELLIIEDGSYQDILKIKNTFNSKRITYFSGSHLGVSHARNIGISNAQGRYIVFLDADDEFLSNHLSSLYQEIHNQKYPEALFRTGMIHSFQGRRIETGLYNEKEYDNSIRFILSTFYGVISFCVARSIFENIRFNESARYFEDSDFFVRALLKFPLYQVPNYTCVAHAHINQTSHRMFFDANAYQNVKSNINTIQDLFRQHPEIKQYLPKGFTGQLISDKYLQHANGLLLASKLRPAIGCLLHSIITNRKISNIIYYIKFVLKVPYKMLSKSK